MRISLDPQDRRTPISVLVVHPATLLYAGKQIQSFCRSRAELEGQILVHLSLVLLPSAQNDYRFSIAFDLIRTSKGPIVCVFKLRILFVEIFAERTVPTTPTEDRDNLAKHIQIGPRVSGVAV